MPTTTALLLALGLAQAAPPDNPDEALKQAGPGEAVNEPLTESSASLAQAWATLQGTKFFPSTPPKLMPYLDEPARAHLSGLLQAYRSPSDLP